MFKERLISGIVLVIIALITVIQGGFLLFAVVLGISLVGMSEIYRVKEVHNTILGVIGYLAAVVYYLLIFMSEQEFIMMISLGFLIVLMAGYVFAFPKYTSSQTVFVFFGFFYVAVMLSFLYQIRTLDLGVYLVWLAFLCSWGCDTSAYCVGVLFGKHKMAPELSPKKSIEGAIGGVVGAAALGAVYATCVNYFSSVTLSPAIIAIICGIGSLISMVGDLAASGVKRDYGVKDYGTLIPGHGGILDRFDSIIFTAPVIYYLAYYLMK